MLCKPIGIGGGRLSGLEPPKYYSKWQSPPTIDLKYSYTTVTMLWYMTIVYICRAYIAGSEGGILVIKRFP